MSKYQDIAQMLDANAIQNTVDAYEKGRADGRLNTLEEIQSKMISLHTDMIFEYGVDIIEARADAFDKLKEWLKEQKNEQM